MSASPNAITPSPSEPAGSGEPEHGAAPTRPGASVGASDNNKPSRHLDRSGLAEALAAILHSGLGDDPCAVLMVAVNKLENINDALGFDVGDEMIAAAARVIKARLRDHDTIGRYSSNRFGIILNQCGPHEMRGTAERLIKAVRRARIRAAAGPLSATISIGGVVIQRHTATVQQAFRQALRALDKARQKPVDCFIAYQPDFTGDTTVRATMDIAEDVISALDDHRMRFVLQPIVSAKTHKPEFYECLLRMDKADGSVVSAGAFIPVGEQLGLIRMIDRRTLKLALALLEKHSDLRLSLNVSSLTSGDHEWLRTLERMTEGRRQMTERLIIEITETAVIHDVDQSILFVDTLKELGCRVAIDDFGSGYSSFKTLKLLDVDMLKIDGVFVENLAEDTSDWAFVKTMVELAKTLGLETVAECVGDERSAQLLAAAGITYLQGFHFGMPVPAEEFGFGNG